VQRKELNLYIDGLLSLKSKSEEEARADLVDLAARSDSLIELLADWLWENDRGTEVALELKLWFGFSYDRLADLYGKSVRELAQLLRNQRFALLGPYPPLELLSEGAAQSLELSCFMVEQRLSFWVDGEWEDVAGLSQLNVHLSGCTACQERLNRYRELQSRVMSERKSFRAFEIEEWKRLFEASKKRQTKRRLQWALAVIILVGLIGVFVGIIKKRPEVMPNIYEISDF